MRAWNDVECPALVDNNFRSSESYLMINRKDKNNLDKYGFLLI